MKKPTLKGMAQSDLELHTHPLLSIATDLHSSSKNAYNQDDYSGDCFSNPDWDTKSSNSATLGLDSSDENSESSSTLFQELNVQTMAVTKLQVQLNDLINRNKASLGMYDGICQLINDYISSADFDQFEKLKKRTPFIRSIEYMYNTHALKPIYGTVKLHNGTHVTVPVFDTKQMIISLLSDKTLMGKKHCRRLQCTHW
jgi:hypothetical protein